MEKVITVSEALNLTGIAWGDQPGATCEVEQVFGGGDEEFVELVVSKQQLWDKTTVIVPGYRPSTITSPNVDNMHDQTMTECFSSALVVAARRVQVGPTWQIQGVMLDANFHLFRFLVSDKTHQFDYSDWVPGAFIRIGSCSVIEMVKIEVTPVRPWMIILQYEATPPPADMPALVEKTTEDYQGFIFHYSTINQVMAFGELWCQPHNWLDRDEVAGSFSSTEEYLDHHGKVMGRRNRPAVAVVTLKKKQLEYETRFVTRIDTWKNKVPLQRQYPVGCTCFSAFHCTQCLTHVLHPTKVERLHQYNDPNDTSFLSGDTDSYEHWYANNIPEATVGAVFPGCLRAAIIDQTQKVLQNDIKEQLQNENKRDGAMKKG